MLRRLRYLLLVLLPLAASACADKKGPPIRVAIAHDTGGGDRCVPSDGKIPDVPIGPATNITHLRISARVHGSKDPSGSFLCDRVIGINDQPFLELPVAGNESYDLFVEGFQKLATDDGHNGQVGSFRRIADGSLLGVDVKSGTAGPLRMYRTESFGCVDSRLKQARAFHTATLLPNGQVLITGGLVADASDVTKEQITNDDLYLTGSTEIYDPATGTFKDLSDASPTLRAFHSAVLIKDSPPYEILLVGGITTDMPSMPALASNSSSQGEGTRLVGRLAGASAGLPTHAASAQVLTYTPDGTPLARRDVAGYTAAAYQASAALQGQLIAAGGSNYHSDGTLDLAQAQEIALSNGDQAPKKGMLSTVRVGASLTPLFNDTSALVWGGNETPMPGQAAADLVGMPGTAPMGVGVMVPGASLTQHHTATLFASDATTANVLVTGGFEIISGRLALQPVAGVGSVGVVTVAGTSVTFAPVTLAGTFAVDPTCTNPNRYRPAGWESAVRIPETGEILITGGAPRTGASGCNDCDSGDALLCSSHQAARFTPPGTLSNFSPLLIGRFGHTMSVLRDGTILVVGGISRPAGGPRTVADAEVFSPRTTVPRYDVAHPEKNDLDDPLYADFANDKDPSNPKVKRAPGENAISPLTGAPVQICKDL